MKMLCALFLVLFMTERSYSQTWQTFSHVSLGTTSPSNGFKIDPYRNHLWYLNYYSHDVMCLELNTGAVHAIYFDACGEICEKDVAFTPDKPFLMGEFSGLYRVNSDYTITNTYNDIDVKHVFQNNDTIYMTLQTDDFLAYTENGSILRNVGFERITAKENWFYPALSMNGSLRKYTGVGVSGYESYTSLDPEYFCPQFHDMKFSPHTDTVYVACTQGITVGYNYDFSDSITPNNTINMPSANVLEFEFDNQNRIWACFGDAANEPFAFACLDGSTWTNYLDNTNCPLNFSLYQGMEIDTSGNLWIAEVSKTHTLISPNSPEWLELSEAPQLEFFVAPNPTTDVLTLSLTNICEAVLSIETTTGNQVRVLDVEGEEVLLDLSELPDGIYFVRLTSRAGTGVKQIVKQ